jgi:hypothetical protein
VPSDERARRRHRPARADISDEQLARERIAGGFRTSPFESRAFESAAHRAAAPLHCVKTAKPGATEASEPAITTAATNAAGDPFA